MYSETCLIEHALGRDILCWNGQDVRLHGAKHVENGHVNSC